MQTCGIRTPYTGLVLAIPHAVGTPLLVDWSIDPDARKDAQRWTDWFTDELFTDRRDGVFVVSGKISRLECDLERLEGEPDRLARFASFRCDGIAASLPARFANAWLAQWFKYRWDLISAAAETERPLIVDCHSFPSDLAPDVDFCIGFNDDASCPPDDVLALVKDTFTSAGYAVAFNKPYANAIAPVGYRGHSLMIEASKRTYLNDLENAKGPGFTRVHRVLGKLYGELLCGPSEMPVLHG